MRDEGYGGGGADPSKYVYLMDKLCKTEVKALADISYFATVLIESIFHLRKWLLVSRALFLTFSLVVFPSCNKKTLIFRPL
jgi:hypothetical protein